MSDTTKHIETAMSSNLILLKHMLHDLSHHAAVVHRWMNTMKPNGDLDTSGLRYFFSIADQVQQVHELNTVIKALIAARRDWEYQTHCDDDD